MNSSPEPAPDRDEATSAEQALVKRKRPKVGEVVDSRVYIADDAFAPLTAEELKEWGL